MKRYLIVVALCFSACTDNFNGENFKTAIDARGDTKVQQNLLSAPARFGPKGEYVLEWSDTDWSGQITTVVYSFTTPSSPYHEASVPVPNDYVLVGGGAIMTDTDPKAGAYLWESRPEFSANIWIAGSKDHKFADPHVLKVYAIGLKIQGVSAATLKTVMTVDHKVSSVASHPNTFAYVNSPYKLVGGGAKANWTTNGSLLVYSYPSGNGWYALSKDHIFPEPATIDVWAIGLQDNIPGFGYIDIAQSTSPSLYVSSGLNTNTSVMNNDWVIACPGAQDSYTDLNGGRMLVSLTVAPDSYHTVQSKDCSYATPGFLYAYGLHIRKRH